MARGRAEGVAPLRYHRLVIMLCRILGAVALMAFAVVAFTPLVALGPRPVRVGGADAAVVLAGSASADGALDDASLRRAGEIERTIDGVRTRLSPDGLGRWPVWAGINHAAEACKARGWTRPEAQLRSLLDKFGPNDHIAESIRALRGASPLAADLVKLSDSLATIDGVEDPVLKAFSAEMKTALGGPAAPDQPPLEQTIA